jgi:hypothetical protein
VGLGSPSPGDGLGWKIRLRHPPCIAAETPTVTGQIVGHCKAAADDFHEWHDAPSFDALQPRSVVELVS